MRVGDDNLRLIHTSHSTLGLGIAARCVYLQGLTPAAHGHVSNCELAEAVASKLGYGRGDLDQGDGMASLRRIASIFGVLTGLTGAASAAPITYSGYDINDAIASGHGNWAHTYSGTIALGGAFTNFSFAGTKATYSGVGSGTLNDGVIGSSVSNSQLFITQQASDGTPFNPVIILTLPTAYYVDRIDLFGGDIGGNSIPGAIAGLQVGLLDTSFNLISNVFSTTPFGTNNVNDEVSLASSNLDGVAAFAVFLSGFTVSTADNWFSLTEIRLDGRLAPSTNVPLPATLPLLMAGLGALGLTGARRRATRNRTQA